MPPSDGLTDEGIQVQCHHCGSTSLVDMTKPAMDAVCPNCDAFVWVHAVAHVAAAFEVGPCVRVPSIEAADKESVLAAMVAALAESAGWDAQQSDEYYRAVLRREEYGSTGWGSGFAAPHARANWLSECVTAIGFVPMGVDFQAMGGAAVHTVILLASPQHPAGDHLLMLQRIARSIQLLRPH